MNIKLNEGQIILASAALAGAMLLGIQLAENSHTPAPPLEPSEGWKVFVEKHGVDYRAYSAPRQDFTAPSRVIAVQAEHRDATRHKLHNYGQRHGHAAADILDMTADKEANANISTTLIDESITGSLFLTNPDAEAFAPLRKTADIIGLSYLLDVKRNSLGVTFSEKTSLQASFFHSVENFDKMWDATRPIVVQSAGNDNYGVMNYLIREEESPLLRHGRYLQVGAAEIRAGTTYVASYSSNVGPAFIVSNPFKEGFRYRYYRDESDIEAGITADMDKDQDLPFRIANNIPACKKDTALQDLLKPGSKAQSAAVNKAISQCFMRHYAEQKRTKSDREGFISNIEGTSFTQPAASGNLAAMMHKYGVTLTHDDIMVLALISNDPVSYILKPNGTTQLIDSYKDNGTGLLHYNFSVAGFGHQNVKNMNLHAQAMVAMRKKDSSLLSIPKRVYSDNYFQENSEAKPVDALFQREIELPVGDDAFTITTMLQMVFFDDKGSIVPPPVSSVTLVSPQGVDFQVPITAENRDNPLSFASTPAFAGVSAKGIWKLRVPSWVSVGHAQISVYGVERGGLADAYFARMKQYKESQENKEKPGIFRRFFPQ